MALSETGRWLEQSLMALSSDGDPVLQLDPDTLYTLVSYCEMAPAIDATEYLLNIVGDERCKDIIAEYMQKRGATEIASHVGMQPYQKSPHEESWSTPMKKAPKQKSGSMEMSGHSSTLKDPDQKSPLLSGHGVLSAEFVSQTKKRAGGKGKKDGKGVSLPDVSKGLVMFTRNGPCNCQCTRHKLINNCLSCGRIVCEQEGEGPCLFCGTLVVREGSEYAGLEILPVPSATEAEVAAKEFKDRLVEYDRTAASRTTVIDDQSDYYEIEGNTWLSEKEKKLLLKSVADRELKEKDSKMRVTIDLLGRKVVLAGQEDRNEVGERLSVLGSEVFLQNDAPKMPRIRPSSGLAEAPIFTDTRQSTTTRSYGTSGSRKSSSGKMLKSNRIQHDDPTVEAIRHSLNDLGSSRPQIPDVLHSPKAQASGEGEIEDVFFECEADMAGFQDSTGTSGTVAKSNQSKSSTKWPTFDICLPHETGKSKAVELSPSILKLKQAERKEALSETSGNGSPLNSVLLPGMILLKRWLSPEQQVDIVNYCRMVGIGPGGFYQPKFGEDAKMHLQMMCLGMQWEPTCKSYGTHRSHYDNALPPSLPDSFSWLVEEALSVAQNTVAEEKGKRDKLGKYAPLPEMHPNVCIVNFYEHGGNLGMHQDKDESEESLQEGIPVVSFSIGDSAEFIYGQQRNVSSSKVVLESGDVLIFGGPSRMIYHGVTQVISDTTPRWLIQKTNLRPGRLNLTFRQY